MAKTVDNFSTIEQFRLRYNELATDVGEVSGLRPSLSKNLVDAMNDLEDKAFYFQEFIYTATASQTAFTGADTFNNTLKFKGNRIQVFKNGDHLLEDTDYSVGGVSGSFFTQVNLNSGASAGDKIVIYAFTGSFEGVTDVVSAATYFSETSENVIYNNNNDGIILNGDINSQVTSLTSGYTIQLEGNTFVNGNVNVDTGHSVTSPNFTGDLTGNVTGDLTGDTTGTHIGPLTSSTGNVLVTAATYITEFRGGGSTEGQIKLNCHVNSHGQTIKPQPHSEGVTNTLTLPAGGDQELVGTSATQTLTNKTITGTFTGSLTGTASDISNHSITGLSDVGGSAPSDGQILVYNASNSRYEATNQNTSDSVTEGSSNLYFTNERVDDRVNALLIGGTGISTVYDDASNTLTINGSAQYGNEDVLDFLGGGGLVGGNGIDLVYDDAANTLTVHSDIEGGAGMLATTEATGENTINIGAGKGVKVNADDVQLDYEVTNSTPGSVGSTSDGHLWFVI